MLLDFVPFIYFLSRAILLSVFNQFLKKLKLLAVLDKDRMKCFISNMAFMPLT